MTQRIRNDGKPARKQWLGTPASRHNGKHADPAEKAPSWHELVQPGPKGDAARMHQRRDDRGQVVTIIGEPGAPITRPARQGGAVRVGRYRPLHSAKTGTHAAGERIRPVKGSRTGGLVEVRRGYVREGMALIRQRPAEDRRAARRAERKAQAAA